MIGYVRADRRRITGAQADVYRGIYCSLCKALGKNYSPAARLLVNYDFAFAAVFRLALKDGSCVFNKGRCAVNPTKECWYCQSAEEFDFCAHCVIIITYYKILDNLHDRGFFKKILSALAFPFIYFMHKKAARLCPEAENIVFESIAEQKKAEMKADCSIDEAAHNSADALGKIFALGFPADVYDDVYSTAYLLGRFIYLLDAADDLQSDIKKGNFNPFKAEFPELKDENAKLQFAGRAQSVLNLTHANLLEKSSQLEYKRFDSIIENIFFNGLYNTEKDIIDKIKGRKESDTFTVK